jgi:hypothetical protein
MRTQLLCTFTNKSELEDTLNKIQDTYSVVYNYIYILQNKTNLDELYVTYNIDTSTRPDEPLEDTILVHRKKEYNVLYTINALNQIIREETGGQLDKTHRINWENYRNSIMVTNTEGSRKIPTRIFEIIDFT